MTEPEQRKRIVAAAAKVHEACELLYEVQSRNPGQPLAFSDLWFTAHTTRLELLRTYNMLKRVRPETT